MPVLSATTPLPKGSMVPPEYLVAKHDWTPRPNSIENLDAVPNNGNGKLTNHEYATPQWLFDVLDAEFEFGLDAAASKESAKCELFFAPENDGLKQDWVQESQGKSIFCNPPWSKLVLKDWIQKGYEESQRGVAVVMVLPSSPWIRRMSWYRDILMQYAEIRLVQGSVCYEGFGSCEGKTVNDSRILTIVAIFRPGQDRSWNGPYIRQPATSRRPLRSVQLRATKPFPATIGLAVRPLFVSPK